MNIKMATHAQVSTTESKNLSKQAEQEQNRRYGGLSCGGRKERWCRRMGEKEQGLRSTNCSQRTYMHDPWT